MNKILAIAGLTFRTVVRSRVLALLLTLVAVSILWLPFIMKGDGTPEGTVRLYLQYALGWAVVLISMAALWTGAGAFSHEVETRRIHTVATKPVRIFHLWTGKWLGLMAMNAVLIALAGALTYGMLRWTTRPSVLSSEDRRMLRERILTARRGIALAPAPVSMHDTAEPVRIHRGRIVVEPQGKMVWQFRVPPGMRPDDPLLVEFRFATSRFVETAPVKTLWTIGPESAPDSHAISMDAAPHVSHSFRIPAESVEDEGLMLISYHNVESERPGYTLFSEDGGVLLLARKSGFEMNYLRAFLVIFARLSFFSSLGLAAGALFSFPTAVFASFAVLLMSAFSRLIELAAAAGLSAMPELRGTEAAAFLDPFVQRVFTVLNYIMPPLRQFDPLDTLASGGLLSWRFVGTAVLVLVGLYSGALALFSGWLFSRREIGLPS